MQTFLPYANYYHSAEALDNKRLQKQIVECKQIYLALTVPTYGWKNHPAVKMWDGYIFELTIYALSCCSTWAARFLKKHSLYYYFMHAPYPPNPTLPPWLGNPEFHLSHQSNLVRKDPEFYGPKFPGVPDNLPYFWPTKNGY